MKPTTAGGDSLKKVLKLTVTIVGVVLILVAIGALLFIPRMDEFARKMMERQLTYLYMTDATIDAVDVALLRQTVEVKGLTVLNPPPFRKGPALSIKRMVVEYDWKSLLTRTARIRWASLEGIDVHLRYEVTDGANLVVLMENAMQLEQGSVEECEASRGTDEPPGVRRMMIIQDFLCGQTTVHISTNLAPFSSASMDIAPFKLKELGEGKPISPARAVVVFLRGLMTETLTFKGLLRPVADAIREEIDRIVD